MYLGLEQQITTLVFKMKTTYQPRKPVSDTLPSQPSSQRFHLNEQ